MPLIIGIMVVLLAIFGLSFLGGALGASLLGGEGLSFFELHRPSPELETGELFHIFSFPISNTILAAWVTIIVLVGICYAATRRISLVPSRLQGLLEMVLEWLLNFVENAAGKENARRFFPLIATVFLFVLMNAWLSLLPFYGHSIYTQGGEELLRGANTDINLPLALALVCVITVEYWGMRSVGGLRYLTLNFFQFGLLVRSIKQIFRGEVRPALMGVVIGLINVFVGLLELLSHFVRIISFTFRLFGNMTAGEILLLIVVFLVPLVFVFPFYGLELLVGLLQALIFAGLTTVFATMAVAVHAEEEG